MSPLTIWCAILDSPDIFSVDIEADETVYELKIKIKERSPELEDFAPKTLSLYQINAFGNNPKERGKALAIEIQRIEKLREADSDSELDVFNLVDEAVGTSPPANTIHILAIPPSGEPIGYCSCGDVAPTGVFSLATR